MAYKENRVKSYQKLEALLLSGGKQEAVYNRRGVAARS